MVETQLVIYIDEDLKLKAKIKCLKSGMALKNYIHDLIEKDLRDDEIASN